jgi:cytochrome oxidase Cu insertion factor (SCO1/SenC/PrrC family)
MPLPDPSLEPAIRDPKKLRLTAFILVGMMLLGGSLILVAYEKWSGSQAKDDRPAVIYRITPERDLRMLRQDGKTVDLVNLRGKVIAINVISLRDPEVAKGSMEVMKRLATARASTQDFAMVSLLVDPQPAETLLATLKDLSTTQGIALPLWWLGSNEPKTLHKFIKNELKTNIYPHETDGKWEYDSSVILLDKNGHIRRAVVPQKRGGDPYVATFDFEQASSWDAKGALTGTERSNTGELELLLNHTIDKLLAEPFKP